MNAIARRIKDLEGYRPERTAQPDLEAFWENTLQEERAAELKGERTKVDSPLCGTTVYDTVYAGFAGTPIHGWLLLPENAPRRPLPCIVLYHGYTGSRELPEHHAAWLLMGYAVFAMDVRGQGGITGNTLDQTNGMSKGWVTQNIHDKDSYYYKAITVDAMRAVRFVREQPEIDSERIIVMGTSQGGGLTLMVSALMPEEICVSVASLPNMCHLDHGILNSAGSISEAADYVGRHPEQLDLVLETLSYFDAMNLAHRIEKPLLCSVSLKDPVCSPDTIYAAYNRIPTQQKEMVVYPFNGHWTGPDHMRRAHEFIRKHLEQV
ncbi:acetylxylan esterase [Gorillibacterium timonense]|uniref:acetylxylan esterase n=1 Tax=Gorillibacterium timonense TaxID=1689269 RepID=UPI00071D7E41|nr:alpha/beta fold hydrolase [Gorillibacterium timonense]